MINKHQLYLAHIFNPVDEELADCYDEGALLVNSENGEVLAVGTSADIIAKLQSQPDFAYETNRDYFDDYILPGFVDTHTHYPQGNLVAQEATGLMQWLRQSVLPGEARMRDLRYAHRVATLFLHSMLEAGTTTALIYGVTYPEAMNVFCLEADAYGLRVYPGKMLMDRNAPAELMDASAGEAYEQCQAFVEQWHGRNNIKVSVAMRSAVTSTPEQMRLTAKLLDEHPDLLFQTHLNESLAEVRAVAECFPGEQTGLGVYEHHGLHRPRSVYGGCVHMNDLEIDSLRAVDAAVAHCPCSNLYLGSGVLDLHRFHDVRLGLGSDVGAGYTYSVLENAKIMHVLQKLRNFYTSPQKLLYHATLGGARALRADKEVGSFAPGKKADFVVLSPRRDHLARELLLRAQDSTEALRYLVVLHNRVHVHATFIDGVCRHNADVA